MTLQPARVHSYPEHNFNGWWEFVKPQGDSNVESAEILKHFFFSVDVGARPVLAWPGCLGPPRKPGKSPRKTTHTYPFDVLFASWMEELFCHVIIIPFPHLDFVIWRLVEWDSVNFHRSPQAWARGLEKCSPLITSIISQILQQLLV